MPTMFLDRNDQPIHEDEWRRAVEVAGARFAPGTLDVELRDKTGVWQRVLQWHGTYADFSMMDYYQPFIDQLRHIATVLGATIADSEGAVYFVGRTAGDSR